MLALCTAGFPWTRLWTQQDANRSIKKLITRYLACLTRAPTQLSKSGRSWNGSRCRNPDHTVFMPQQFMFICNHLAWEHLVTNIKLLGFVFSVSDRKFISIKNSLPVFIWMSACVWCLFQLEAVGAKSGENFMNRVPVFLRVYVLWHSRYKPDAQTGFTTFFLFTSDQIGVRNLKALINVYWHLNKREWGTNYKAHYGRLMV